MAFEDPTRHPVAVTIDLLAASAVVGTVVSWLPPIAAFLSIIWFAIQIWESKSCQAFVARWRKNRIP